MKQKIIFNWSSGKDSALALYQLKKDNAYQVAGLLTTITKDYQRVSMHGIRRKLLVRQVDSIGLPLDYVYIEKNANNSEYEAKVKSRLEKYQKQGINTVAFGDIFLQDLRKRREKKLARIGMEAIFPIWKKDTKKLANKFIESGFKAIVVCVDSKILNKKFVGREFNKQFLADLPASTDPCGENGEFHTFVYDGPIFKRKILFKKGQIILRNKRFYYCDLAPQFQRRSTRCS